MPAGAIIGGGILPATFGGVGAWDDARQPVDLAAPPSAGPAPAAGTKTDTQPISEIAAAHAGALLRTFVSDYYDRVHFSGLVFRLGNIIAGVSRTVTVWNAFFTRKSIRISSIVGGGGVSVSGLGASGTDIMQPLQVGAANFLIGTDGPPLLRAGYTFTIDDPA